MRGASRANAMSEQAAIALLCAWLIWIPLPFGSNVSWARMPLIAVPLLCCLIACAARARAGAERGETLSMPRAWTIWNAGALLFLTVGALQLVPLPSAVHRLLEPESHAFWQSAAAVATLAGESAPLYRPLTLEPDATAAELLRLCATYAAFTAAALLVRNHPRRLALAVTLVLSASFQSLYGAREAAMQRYAIWGWLNRLVHNRVTGTFVNPNHFAHYLVIVLPVSLFLVAAAWRAAGREPMPLSRRIMAMLEVRPWLTGAGILGALISVLGMLLAQSRGALLALGTGVLIVIALAPGHRRLRRMAVAASCGILLFIITVLFLGTERTVERFSPTDAQRATLGGRTTGSAIAARLWQRFPLFGTGWGTFQQVASMEQKTDLELVYNRAHNDYLEIAATSGTLGAVVALVSLFGGVFVLVRDTFRERSRDVSWRRRAWQVAALTSICIAMVHALFDFNFFIPANAATLAVIAGVAVAPLAQDMRARR